jgi:hypothetical protein
MGHHTSKRTESKLPKFKAVTDTAKNVAQGEK